MYQPLELPGLLLASPRRITDHRGHFVETWRQDLAEGAGLPAFVQENESLSLRTGTLRGLHFQAEPMAQAKLVRCVRGALFDVAVDLRRSSPAYGRYQAVELSAANGLQLFIPAGFAHGFLTLEPETLAVYKVSAPYSPAHDLGLAWDDPDLGIAWPLPSSGPVLSDRDRAHPRLKDLPDHFPDAG